MFCLDMGKSVRIQDVAKALIRLSGLSEKTIKIKYTHPRPGEKLTEALYDKSSERLKAIGKTKIFGIFKINSSYDKSNDWIDKLIDAAKEYEDNKIKDMLTRSMPTLNL
jgi:FlaA1/EpsC-like NDP-sugar epimerase